VSNLILNLALNLFSSKILDWLKGKVQAAKVTLPQVLFEHTTDLQTKASSGGWEILSDITLPPAPPTPQPVMIEDYPWGYEPWGVQYADMDNGYIPSVVEWISDYYGAINQDGKGVVVTLKMIKAATKMKNHAVWAYPPGFTTCPGQDD